jgi:hypothetical protein
VGNAKGSVIVGPVKYLRKRKDQAREVLPPDLLHYLEDEVRLSSWYPERDFEGLVRSVAKLMPMELDAAIEAIGAAGANEHADVYGDLLRTLESSSSLFALWGAQHDSGELRGTSETPTRARVTLVGFDSPSETNCLLARGYIRGGLAANGFEDVAIEKLHCVLKNDSLCEWRVSWKNPEATPVTPGLARRRTR